MKRAMLMGAALLLFAGSGATMDRSDGAATPQDAAAIQHVMDVYHHAVATHDGQAVSALFLDRGGNLVSVLSGKAFAVARTKNASIQKVRITSAQDFAKFVASTTSSLDPRHTDVRITSDGTVASVYFHFDFVIDGKVENHGDETWQLVKTADGWRIVAITYSSNPGTA